MHILPESELENNYADVYNNLYMGLTNVNLKVKNIKNPARVLDKNFLVDSGAIYTVVPADELKKIGIEPQREETFSLADGTTVKRKIGSALYEFQGTEA